MLTLKFDGPPSCRSDFGLGASETGRVQNARGSVWWRVRQAKKQIFFKITVSLFFLTPRFLTPPPLPTGILYSPQFCLHQETKMAARRTQQSTSTISRKNGVCEQSICKRDSGLSVWIYIHWQFGHILLYYHLDSYIAIWIKKDGLKYETHYITFQFLTLFDKHTSGFVDSIVFLQKKMTFSWSL